MLELLTLPEIVLEKILCYLSYDDIARHRLICRQFDAICRQLLNKGFLSAERYHCQCIKSVKTQLPRRESERRSHPLARHCDILTAIETRLSMLSMTFMKYVDMGLCCFIPGKVIDEIFRVLRYVRDCKTPPRAHEILQELRDISSMAMEHFDEHIVPALRCSLVGSQVQASYSMAGSSLMASTAPPNVLTQEKVRLEFHKLHYRLKRNKTDIDKLRFKAKRQTALLTLQGRKLRSQGAQISDLKRHLEEWDHKFGDLAAELSRAREDSITEAAQSIRKCPTVLETDAETSETHKEFGFGDSQTVRCPKRKLPSTTEVSRKILAVLEADAEAGEGHKEFAFGDPEAARGPKRKFSSITEVARKCSTVPRADSGCLKRLAVIDPDSSCSETLEEFIFGETSVFKEPQAISDTKRKVSYASVTAQVPQDGT